MDVLGHTRKVNGAIGAYEGSWVVGGQTITEDTTVDYCDFKSTDTISFTGEDRFLSVKEAAYIDGATFTAENRSYLAVPAIGSIINTSFSDNIRICEYSANVQMCIRDSLQRRHIRRIRSNFYDGGLLSIWL